MTSQNPGSGNDRGYKRSWKNLLINKRYQLRFTLFMVGLSSLLMLGLGIWVMRVANETTEVSMTSVRGEACPKVPAFGDVQPGAAPAPTGEDATPPAAGSDAAPADGEERHVKVQLDESSMTLTLPPDFADRVMKHWSCELLQDSKLHRLEHGRQRILWALILTGIVLVLGLAIYGIKMTHRVAGPLFKVSLYLAKMRAGRFDKVYNLRKGDQLIHFYDHFKLAHGGIVTMQRDDIARIAAVVSAAEAAGMGQRAEVAALRDLLAGKEKAIE